MSAHPCVLRGLLGAVLGLSLCAGAANGQPPVRLSLEECIGRSLVHHPRLALAESDITVREARLDQARAARYRPTLSLNIAGGPVPSAEGSPYDPDLRTDWSSWGAFARAEVTGIQPLYTFGKLEGVLDAARSWVDVAQHARQQAENEVRRETGRLYYGLLLAREMKDLATDALDRLGKARARVRRSIEAGDGQYTSIDEYRLDASMGEVEARLVTVSAAEAALLTSLKAAMGFTASQDVDVTDEGLAIPERLAVDAESAVREATAGRTELLQLRAGDQALAGLARSARAEAFPQFFAIGLLQSGAASKRTDQKNPFVWDSYNFLRGGVAVGFRYSLDFAATRARVREADAERARLAAQRRAAETSIAVHARNSAQALEAARRRTDVRTKSAAVGRRWLASAESTFNLGVGETRDLVDAFQAYLLSRVALLEAMHDEQVARAEFEYARGAR